MNNWILLVTLGFLLATFYILGGRKIIASCIFVLSYLVPITVVIFYSDITRHELSDETVLIILAFAISFFVGEVLVCHKVRLSKSISPIHCYDIKKEFLFVFYIIQLLNLWFSYRFIMAVGAEMGANNFISAYAATRIFLVRETDIQVPVPSYYTLIGLLSIAIEILCVHIYILNKLYFSRKEQKKILGVVVLYFMALMLNTGRAALFPPIIHIVYLFMIVAQRKMGKSFSLRKYKKTIVSSVIAGMIVFVALGTAREDKQGEGEVEIQGTYWLTAYIGAPIVGLDLYINKGMPPYNNIGAHTFQHVHMLLGKLGFPTGKEDFKNENFYFGEVTSNVKSAIYYWISDFGLLGALLFTFVLGGMYGLIDKIKDKRLSLMNIIGISYISSMYFALLMIFFCSEFYSLFSYGLVESYLIVYLMQKKCLKIHNIGVDK